MFRSYVGFTPSRIALALHQAYPLSYWDAAILAAAQQSGCTLVLSEDMSDGETYGTVTVRNPFAVICS